MHHPPLLRCGDRTIAWHKRFALGRMLRHRRMPFAYSESADVVRAALGSVLRQRREAVHRTLTEVAGEAGLSPAHLSEGERGRKEVSTERLLAVAHALGVRPAGLYAVLARLLTADSDRPACPQPPPPNLPPPPPPTPPPA